MKNTLSVPSFVSRLFSLAAGGVAFCATAGLSLSAHAGAPECGGAHVERGAYCEIKYTAGCRADCDVDSMLSTCAAELMASCQGGCNLDVDVTCTDDCQVQCEDQCRADGGQVICNDGCMGECRGACDDRCAGADDADECYASCEATCSGECEESCANVPADADCTEACKECCHGSCSARVNLDCQLGCQASGFSDCQAAALDECSGSCGIEGSIFCDGQYIVSGSDVSACADALRERGVIVETNTDVDLEFGDEDGDGSGSIGLCRVSSDGGGWSAFAVLGLLGLVATRRGRP